MKKINDLYGKIGPKKGDVIIESMAIESFVQPSTETKKRESTKSKGKLARLKTTAIIPSNSSLKIKETYTDDSG